MKINDKDMTQEEKEMLIKDLCGRLPYGLKVYYKTAGWEDKNDTLSPQVIDNFLIRKDVDVKPYLRPMSSMTEDEYNELKEISSYYGLAPFEDIHNWTPNCNLIDWLNAHHFDYRGLIPMGLALEAKDGMYNN